MTHTSKRDLICIILSFCILIVLIVASWFTAKEVVLSFTGIKTEGIVTTVESISGNRSNGGVTIQYSFTDHNNIQYTTTDIYIYK